MSKINIYVGSSTIPSAVTPLTSITFAGDSFTQGGNNGDSLSTRFGTVAVSRLNTALGWSATENNVGSGGARQFLAINTGVTDIGTQVYRLTAPPTSAPYAPPLRCLVIQASINNLNLTECISDLSGTVMAALKRSMHRVRAGGGYEGDGGSQFSYSGYSTSAETDDNTGPGVKQATANGSTVTLTLPSDFPGGTVYMYGPMTRTFGAVESFTLDGVSQGTLSTKTATVTTGASQPWVMPITVSSGSHTIVMTASSMATVENFNGADFEHGTPPYIVVLNTARAPTYPGGSHTTTDTDVANSNSALTSMLASEFPSDPTITVVDIDTILGKNSANFGADGIHPNPTGNGLIADGIVSAIRSLMGV